MKTARGATTRNVSVEALRVVAILSIALFHVFQRPFADAAQAELQMLGGGAGGTVAFSAVARLIVASPWYLGLLGFINLLGAFGNHVFFAISGGFLIPSAARRSTEDGYAGSQIARTVRRAAKVLASACFYLLVAFAVNAWVMPVQGLNPPTMAWLGQTLEFIWVYLALVAATPLIGWAWRRCRRRAALVALLDVVVLSIGFYIAFVSPGGGDRALLEWRKLMSAASYLASFLSGAAVAEACRRALRAGAGCDDERRRSGLHGRICAITGILAAGALALELALAFLGRADLMVASSFKSTSLISFVLALAALACALTAGQGKGTGRRRAERLVARAAQGILGVYVSQAIFLGSWLPSIMDLGNRIAGLAAVMPHPAAFACLLASMAGLSLAMVAATMLFDAATRQVLLRFCA